MSERYLRFSLAGLALLLPAIASAATFWVSKTADTNDGVCDADCSLREAVAAAAASPSDDVIEFDPVLFATEQTITLSGSEIVIIGNGRLDIVGPGAGLLTLSGNNASRVIVNSPNAVTTLSDIRIVDGNGVGATNSGRGGALYNVGGDLSLHRVVLVGNTAANGGSLNNASGGTPTVPATLLVDNCLFTDNSSSGSGGAIQNFSTSTLTIRNSAFVGNTSNGSTGGGAGQFNGFVTLSNTTFSGNSAPNGSGGAIQSNGPLLLMTNVTLTGNTALNNGGGLHRATASAGGVLRNTIVAGNHGSVESPDVTHSAGGLSSLGHNLIGVVGSSTAWIGSDLLNQDAGLDILDDNGGFTPTHALMPDSAAIDAGDDCVLDQSCAQHNPGVDLDTDQRGEPRPGGAATDIGAFEAGDSDDVIFADGFEGG